ncbi:uncharacterized protein LOC143691066 isoform X3 [Tamandua tetradactyla]|uniref:uncharacterized protein LOC143691066 isoform X3 n=1 Tax=Tamandua tetradactyla TaxID=48850 RepID=UPI004053808F
MCQRILCKSQTSSRLKMVFGLCCQTERFCKSLYAIHIFMLAAFLHLPVEVVYYYFQGSMQKTGPDYEIAGEPSQPIGETLRPVWEMMAKCCVHSAMQNQV